MGDIIAIFFIWSKKKKFWKNFLLVQNENRKKKPNHLRSECTCILKNCVYQCFVLYTISSEFGHRVFHLEAIVNLQLEKPRNIMFSLYGIVLYNDNFNCFQQFLCTLLRLEADLKRFVRDIQKKSLPFNFHHHQIELSF